MGSANTFMFFTFLCKLIQYKQPIITKRACLFWAGSLCNKKLLLDVNGNLCHRKSKNMEENGERRRRNEEKSS
jgi:hypothetical protein